MKTAVGLRPLKAVEIEGRIHGLATATSVRSSKPSPTRWRLSFVDEGFSVRVESTALAERPEVGDDATVPVRHRAEHVEDNRSDPGDMHPVLLLVEPCATGYESPPTDPAQTAATYREPRTT